MVIETLLIIDPDWKQTKCPLLGERTNKQRDSHTMGYSADSDIVAQNWDTGNSPESQRHYSE